MFIAIAVLAVMEVIDIWRHSALLDRARAHVELWDNKLGQLLRCPFCLSPWLSLLAVLVLDLSDMLIQHGFRLRGSLIAAPIYAFGIAKLANLVHDLVKFFDRTPKHELSQENDPEVKNE